jgi:CD63 antigen
MLIFISEIGIGIAGYVKHAELQSVLEKQFNTTFDEYETSIEAQRAWSLLQSEMEW